ncbi:MAG: ribosome assembly factor SBDS [Candidatus Aenigmatarchaeota archaeon]
MNSIVIARYNKGGYNFEIYVDLEKAILFKEGKIKNIEEVLKVHEIFKDAKKGERVSSEILKKIFGKDDILEISKEIILNGEIQITTEYRRKLVEEKKKQVIEYIRRISIDPRTNAPFTYQRIEEMIKDIKYSFDPYKPAEKQAEEIIKELKKKYPIKIEIKRVLVKIPLNKLKIVGIIKKKYGIVEEKYEDFWIGLFDIPVALYSEFVSDISKLSEGEAEIVEIKK